MRQRIVINSTHQEARVALLENETLVEIHIERAQQRNVAGNIYLGRVNRILPGMQAAFVDIGLEKAGFIHASDVFGGPLPPGMIDDTDEQDPDTADLLDDFDLTESGERVRRGRGVTFECRAQTHPWSPSLPFRVTYSTSNRKLKEKSGNSRPGGQRADRDKRPPTHRASLSAWTTVGIHTDHRTYWCGPGALRTAKSATGSEKRLPACGRPRVVLLSVPRVRGSDQKRKFTTT